MIHQASTRLLATLKEHRPPRAISALTVSTIVTMAVPVFCTPFIADLYSPAQLGTFATFGAIVSAIVLVASMRLEQAVPLPKRPRDASVLISIAFVSGWCMSLVALVVVVLFGSPIALYLGDPDLEPLLWFVPISAILGTTTQCLSMWLIRQADFVALARTRGGQSVGTAIFQIGCGTLKFSAGMVAGSLLGQAQTTFLSLRAVLKHPRSLPRRFPRMRSIAMVLRKYSDFPTYSLFEAFVGQLQAPLLVISVTKLFSPTACGLLLLGQRLSLTPAALITQATGPIMMQRMAVTASDATEVRRIMLRTWARMAIYILPLYAALFFMLHLGIPFLFGEQWLGVLSVVDRFAPLCAVQLIFAPTTSAAVVLRKQHLSLLWAVAALGSKLLGLWLSTTHDYLWLISWFVTTDILSLVSFNLVLAQLAGARPSIGEA